MRTEVYTIDAKGKKLGRVASEAASVLLGKHKPDFEKRLVSGTKVEIINADGLLLSEEKREKKKYVHYTGYPSGLRERTMEEVITKRGLAEVIRRAVQGMLPRNKLRDTRMKNLIIK